MKSIINLTKAEKRQLLFLLDHNEKEGTYYGTEVYYKARAFSLKQKIEKL